MKILIACEFSGTVRDAFIRRGFDAISCDYLPSERPGPHLQGDVIEFLYRDWDLIIAHPPCTYLANSGSHLLENPGRMAEMYAAVIFFRMLMDAPCRRVCVENPIPHFYALGHIGRAYTQKIQPWQFGHRAMKSTCLWLRGLPNLQPCNIVGPPPRDRGERSKWEICLNQPGKGIHRQRERARTYPGIADAMAEQWGRVLTNGA